MDVNGVGFFPGNEVPHLPGGAAVPYGVQRQQQFGQPVGRLLVAALIHHHPVAAALQQGALRREDGILTARQAVMAVDEQDLHGGFPPCCDSSPILLLYPF